MSRREDIASVDESATKGTDSLSSRQPLTPLESELLAALKASEGIEPLLMELGDCMDRERAALTREYRAIRKQVTAAIGKAEGRS